MTAPTQTQCQFLIFLRHAKATIKTPIVMQDTPKARMFLFSKKNDALVCVIFSDCVGISMGSEVTLAFSGVVCIGVGVFVGLGNGV